MRDPLTFSAITISLWSILVIGSQPSTLPSGLAAHLKTDQFQTVTSIRGLPLGVRDALGELVKGQYTDFAEPGTPFRATDVGPDPRLPVRRLAIAACARDHHCVVYYERGGSAHTWHVAMFQWSPDATRFEWGGIAPGGLRGIDEVRNAMLSGAVKAGAPLSW